MSSTHHQPVKQVDREHPRVPPGLVLAHGNAGPVLAGDVEVFFATAWNQARQAVKEIAPVEALLRDHHFVAVNAASQIRQLTRRAIEQIAAGFDPPDGRGPVWFQRTRPETPQWEAASTLLDRAGRLAVTTTAYTDPVAPLWARDVRSVVTGLPRLTLADAPGGKRAAYSFLALDSHARQDPHRYARLSPVDLIKFAAEMADFYTGWEARYALTDQEKVTRWVYSDTDTERPVPCSTGQIEDDVLANEVLTWRADVALPVTAAELWVTGRLLTSVSDDLPSRNQHFDAGFVTFGLRDLTDLVDRHRRGTPVHETGRTKLGEIIDHLDRVINPPSELKLSRSEAALIRLYQAIDAITRLADRLDRTPSPRRSAPSPGNASNRETTVRPGTTHPPHPDPPNQSL